MMQWSVVIKHAKACHSKLSWCQFTDEFGDAISEANSSKPLEELFRILKNDKQALTYTENLWCSLLTGCMSCWNLNLGREISLFVDSIPSTRTRLKSAEIHMESGHPSTARKVANKGLRLKNISQVDMISFRLIICKSYVEEGRHESAKRMLQRLEESVNHTNLPSLTKADMLINIARSKFFLGNYSDAAFLFSRAYRIYRFHKKWEPAASSLFNSAASYDNSGMDFRERALKLVTKCEQLSEKHRLLGPLSHCHAFHATYYHQKGQFAKSIEHYRKALRLIPSSEKSFRKLHIVSMLTFTLFKSGQFKLANRYGTQTLKLAKNDESERFRIRYSTLKAELDWQMGDVDSSYRNLERSYKSLESNGVNTLEELSTLSRFNVKSSQLNVPTNPNIVIAKSLKSNNATWLEYRISSAYQSLTRGKISDAQNLARLTLKKSQEFGFQYFEAQSLSLLLMTKISQQAWDRELDEWLTQFDKLTLNNDLKVFRAHLGITQASKAYYEGDFSGTLKVLNDSLKLTRLPLQKREILTVWKQTISGNSPRLNSTWKESLIISATRVYFAPSIETISESEYLISTHYRVSLTEYPVLNRLLRYLLEKKEHTATPEEIQADVWQQSTNLQGWQQKIRNSITRLRALFPYTLAPLILYDGDHIKLFVEAIEIKNSFHSRSNEERIIDLLSKSPLSTFQIASEIMISSSTTKRILKKLITQKKVSSTRVGRKVLYKHHTQQNLKTYENELYSPR